MKEKYEAEKKKNKAMRDVKINVGNYKSELDKARKELKDAN